MAHPVYRAVAKGSWDRKDIRKVTKTARKTGLAAVQLEPFGSGLDERVNEWAGVDTAVEMEPASFPY